ncbi:hypothetical protein MNBD_BACTEROID07-235 [hydrothermal vent metagenome]|uniref:Uncharacterized protein n=1 Tax=hydrothermal vent metagenome TaxID=652676 RepID=A0A3B0U619_9ZZZZ
MSKTMAGEKNFNAVRFVYHICSHRVSSIFHIPLQIFLHYPDSTSKIFLVYKKL